jgi:heat shock protein beta
LALNLGTIAKSGTTNFLEALKGGNINLIGQFCVGFYSTSLAGSKVEVIFKSNSDKQIIWVSEAAISYNLYENLRGDTLCRGTEVKICLKEDALNFLKHKKIAKLIKNFSEFIDFPIYL